MPLDSHDPCVLARRAKEEEEAPGVEAPAEEAPAQGPAVAPRPWVLLCAVPRIREDLMRKKDLSFDLAPAPAVSSLGVSRNILRGDTFGIPVNPGLPDYHFPYIAAVEPSGRALLLCANHAPDPVDGAGAHHYPRLYMVCDAAADTTSGVVELVSYGHPGSAGLVTLHYRTLKQESDWVMETLYCDRPSKARPWRNDGSFVLNGKLWWVDLACGLLTYDVLSSDKELRHVPLPPQCTENTTGDLGKTRCVRTSGGRVRCVLIHQPNNLPSVTMWSFKDDNQWGFDWTVPFSSIWVHRSYFSAPQLFQDIPDLVAIDPYDSDVVYFSQGANSLIFAVNVPVHKLLERADSGSSSHPIHVWELPPELYQEFHGPVSCFSLWRALLSICQPAEESDPPFAMDRI
ncbi:hypothetical protein QOZ80_8AG0629140 [Eleusine coracana subsp. coracana]|nr:hypothetical protein QOZ80_8AG0629140 [Eleusine coracana subsp. coracana]